MNNRGFLTLCAFSLLFLLSPTAFSAPPLIPGAPPSPPQSPGPPADSALLSITDVTVSTKTFNPSAGQNVLISYRCSRPSRMLLRVFDPTDRLVWEAAHATGGNIESISWDGKDMDGNIVPDEAYFFTIEAADSRGHFALYDPTATSGGDPVTLQDLSYDRDKKLLTYWLTADARVRIRAGVSSGGPLLKTLVNGVPKASGLQELTWDGKDESGIISAVDVKGYIWSADAVSLPENSIICLGNSETDIFHYQKEVAGRRPIKPTRPQPEKRRKALTDINYMPIKLGLEPKFRIEIARTEESAQDNPPLVKGRLPIRIHLDEQVKKYATEQRYELLFFVNFKFISELEEGHSPINWTWDSTQVENGEHTVTVNVITLDGQSSSGSVKVSVKN